MRQEEVYIRLFTCTVLTTGCDDRSSPFLMWVSEESNFTECMSLPQSLYKPSPHNSYSIEYQYLLQFRSGTEMYSR